jgi:hypothetical protein
MNRRTVAAILVLMSLAAITEYSMGRRAWGTGGTPGLWSGDIWSEHNSQFVADPYSFTHVIHGVGFYALFALVARGLPAQTRLIGTVALESGWEILENSDFIIQRYRKETVSLNYYGDSIVNSMSDVIACMCGFLLAWRLPTRFTVAGTIIVEILLAIWIRDNLTLNILMLFRPTAAIRAWQLGK